MAEDTESTETKIAWLNFLKALTRALVQINLYKADHPQVGVNFNLCHWLKVDGDKDYRPVLRENAGKIFVVTINGAQVGSSTWTDGLIQPLDRGDFDNRQLLATLREVAVMMRAREVSVLDAPTPEDDALLREFEQAHGLRFFLQTGGPDSLRPLHDPPVTLEYVPGLDLYKRDNPFRESAAKCFGNGCLPCSLVGA